MKKIFIILGIISIAGCNSNSEKTPNEEFVTLSEDLEFVESHDEPKEIQVDLKGQMIKIPVANEMESNAYFIKSKEETNQYLFLIHEWWGLNDFVKSHGDLLSDKLHNVNIVALDLYDGNVATTGEKAMEYMKGADEARIQSILNAAIEMTGNNAKIASIGWCFGGGWSLKTALAAKDKSVACIMYYGMPVTDVAELEKLNSNVLFIYGKQDKWINEEVANTFADNMEKANKRLVVAAYDADHAFANPSSEHYIEEAAQEANAKALNFLSENKFGIKESN